MMKALKPQNNIQTRPLAPTLAKSNSPTQLESRPPPTLPGAKGTQPPRVDYRSKPRGAQQRPQPPSVPVVSQPQQQPSAPRLPQRPLSPIPDAQPVHPVYPTTGSQKTIATPKGVQPPPLERRAGTSYTKTCLPPPVFQKKGLCKSIKMSPAQGQSSLCWKDRTAQGEEPSKPALMPKPGRPSIASKPPLPAKPSLANRTPSPVTKPKPKQMQVQNSLPHACSSATHVQELTKDSVDHVGELEWVQESCQPLNATLSSIIVSCLALV